jgi:hypothetical protein
MRATSISFEHAEKGKPVKKFVDTSPLMSISNKMTDLWYKARHSFHTITMKDLALGSPENLVGNGTATVDNLHLIFRRDFVAHRNHNIQLLASLLAKRMPKLHNLVLETTVTAPWLLRRPSSNVSMTPGNQELRAFMLMLSAAITKIHPALRKAVCTIVRRTPGMPCCDRNFAKLIIRNTTEDTKHETDSSCCIGSDLGNV